MGEALRVPLLLWLYLCTGLQSIIQTRFLMKFSKVNTKPHYYIIFVSVAYLLFSMDMFVATPPSFFSQIVSLMMGIFVIYVFSRRILKQTMVTSVVMGVLLITTNVLIEGILTPLHGIVSHIFSLPPARSNLLLGFLIILATFASLHFFSEKYNISSAYQSQYLLILIIPMLFIDIVIRMLMDTNHFSWQIGYKQVSYDFIRRNIEFLLLSIFAFVCVCGMLFVYEKVTHALESEHQKTVLQNQLMLQKNYIAEAQARYQASSVFRHDLKNHVITLKGMLEKNEMDKATQYLQRFETISDYLSLPVSTGNMVIDIILCEKLAHAKAAGIHIQYDIAVTSTVGIDDFDLSVIFSNTIDNAIKACSHMKHGDKILDIVAKQNKNFFVLDMINSFEDGTVPKGTGLGLPSLKMIVDKYHGAMEIVSADGIFHLSVLLPFGDCKDYK